MSDTSDLSDGERVARRRPNRVTALGNFVVPIDVVGMPCDAQASSASQACNTPLRTEALRQRNLQRPAVQLANEILMQIFEMACATQVGFFRQEYLETVKIRNTICHTCSRWRDIATNDTALWNTIGILDLNGHNPRVLRHHLDRLHVELHRARRRPLELHAWQHVRVNDPVLPIVLDICSAANRRYGSIKFHVSASLHESLVFLQAPGMSESLTYLKLDPTEGPHWDEAHNAGDVYEHEEIMNLIPFSSLTHLWVSFGGTRDDYGVRLLIRPPEFSKITHLHLRGNIEPISCLRLINASRHLINLSWKDQRRIHFKQLSNGRIELHPFLQDVSLQGGFPVSFASDMDCPNLERLRLGGHDRCTFVQSVWDGRNQPLSSDSRRPRFPKLSCLQVRGYPTTQHIGPFILAHAHLSLAQLVIDGVFDEYLANCLNPALSSLRYLDVPGLRPDQLTYVSEILQRRASCKPVPQEVLILGLHDQLAENGELRQLEAAYGRVGKIVFNDYVEQAWAWGRPD